jgi:hypothetical protein
MSDNPNTDTHVGNGAALPTPKKRRIATASFSGSVGKITFATGEVVEVDAAKLPATLSDIIKAYGAINIIQTAYSASDTPVEAARAMLKRLMAGDWRPGLPRREAEPDVLTQALMAHLQKPAEFISEVWVPAYAKKHDLVIGAAKRKLREHGVISALIAKITAERAAAAAQAARGGPREALDLTI